MFLALIDVLIQFLKIVLVHEHSTCFGSYYVSISSPSPLANVSNFQLYRIDLADSKGKPIHDEKHLCTKTDQVAKSIWSTSFRVFLKKSCTCVFKMRRRVFISYQHRLFG